MTSAKALWTSKSTFISMTLNSLPIKDKSPFHTRSSICQCHHTKKRGNLFMPNMPLVSTFGRPFEHCFLIKRGSLSSLFLAGMSLWYHFPQLEIVTITYLSITVLLWLPSGCHSPLLFSLCHRVPAKSDTPVCIETALIFTHHTLAGAGGTNGFYLQAEGTRTAWREAVGWWWVGEGQMSGTGAMRGSWPNSLHPIPRLLPSSHWQLGRLRAKISSHFLTEGQGDTVLRMNGHVMLSML